MTDDPQPTTLTPPKATHRSHLRIRVSEHDAHYAGGLVSGAWILGLFGDLATELALAHDRDEGLLRAYRDVEFLAPVRAGDFVEANAWFTRMGQTSRDFACEAWRVAELDPEAGATRGHLLSEPLLIARATGTVVCPR